MTLQDSAERVSGGWPAAGAHKRLTEGGFAQPGERGDPRGDYGLPHPPPIRMKTQEEGEAPGFRLAPLLRLINSVGVR